MQLLCYEPTGFTATGPLEAYFLRLGELLYLLHPRPITNMESWNDESGTGPGSCWCRLFRSGSYNVCAPSQQMMDGVARFLAG